MPTEAFDVLSPVSEIACLLLTGGLFRALPKRRHPFIALNCTFRKNPFLSAARRTKSRVKAYLLETIANSLRGCNYKMINC